MINQQAIALPTSRRGVLSSAWSENPDKRRMERFVLCYSPLWMGCVFAVMFTRAMARWSDGEHLVLGAGLALPIWLAPVLFPSPTEKAQPLAQRYSFRFNALLGLFVLIQTWIGSELFFQKLGMEYHFHTTLELNGTPVFLYFMTVAYFSTYYVLMTLVWRVLSATLAGASPALMLLVRAALGYAVAFGETFFMCNEMLRQYFFYRDPRFTLLVGSICYGTLFFITLPFFVRLDEKPLAERPTLRALTVELLALNMVALMAYHAYGAVIGNR